MAVRHPKPTMEDAVRALARRLGRSEADMLEDWNELAAVREYERGQYRAAAEAAALDDLRARHEPQRRLM